jgi:hypothetical protein
MGASLLLLAACPSLGEIGVGSPKDATASDGSVSAPDRTGDRDAAPDVRCDAETRSDPHNCGRCGHDCLGGVCSSGVCQPVVLYSGDTPISIVVDGADLLVAVQAVGSDTGYVFRCTATDCQSTKTVLAKGLDNPWFAAKEGSSIYWVNFGGSDAGADPGTVMGCAKAGCPEGGPVVYSPEGGGVDGGENMSGFAANGSHLYWANVASIGFIGTVYECVAEECAGTLAELSSSFGFPFAVAVDDSNIYWINSGPNQVLRCALPSCGSTPEVFANIPFTGAVPFSGLALYADDVYWTQGSAEGGVFTCPKSGCGASPTTLATGQASPTFVAVDDSGVYWANGSGGTIMQCPLSGCKAPNLLASTVAPFAIALDPVSVYFTNSGAFGEVLRVAK